MDAKLRNMLRQWRQGSVTTDQMVLALRRSGGTLELLTVVPGIPDTGLEIDLMLDHEDSVFGPWDLDEAIKALAPTETDDGFPAVGVYNAQQLAQALPELVSIFAEANIDLLRLKDFSLKVTYWGEEGDFGDSGYSAAIDLSAQDRDELRTIYQALTRSLGIPARYVVCDQVNRSSNAIWKIKEGVEEGFTGFYGKILLNTDLFPLLTQRPDTFSVTVNGVDLGYLTSLCLDAEALDRRDHREIKACRLGIVCVDVPENSLPVVADTTILDAYEMKSDYNVKTPTWIPKTNARGFEAAVAKDAPAHFQKLLRFVLQIRTTDGVTFLYVFDLSGKLIQSVSEGYDTMGQDPLRDLLYIAKLPSHVVWFPLWACRYNDLTADLDPYLDYRRYVREPADEIDEEYFDID